MKKEVNLASEVKPAKVEKDYSKFFDFSNAKVISEDEHGKKIRIAGRDI
jgi:tRNA-2-methylthio-N6-dimethylallyladenosine synthase